MVSLAIANTTGLITREIEQAPADMMARELIQNAIEASKRSKTPKIYCMETDPADFGITYYPFDNQPSYSKKKLTFWNNGSGMSATELRNAVDLASSIGKIQGLLGNFGIGAKIAALSSNQKGMIWVSCKDSIVSLVFLLKEVNPKTGHQEYVRYDFFDTDAESKSKFKDVLDITELDTLHWSTDEDWTAIILCGNNVLQNTTERPYHPAEEEGSGWLVNNVYSRFYRIDPAIEFRFFTGHGFAHKNSIRFVSIDERINSLCETNPDNIKQEVVTLENDVKIRYVWDGPLKPNSTEKNADMPMTIYSNPTSRQGTFSGIVWKNELYDVATAQGNSWRATANLFNILYNSKYFRIFVELPDDFAILPDAHRKKLVIEDAAKTQVKLLDYAPEVRAHMPQWFKDKIKSYAPNNFSSDDIQKQAQEMLDKLMAKPVKSGAGVQNKNGKPKSPSKTEERPDPIEHITKPRKPKTYGGIGAAKDVQETFPQVIYVMDETDLDNSGADQLKNRAGQYTETAVYINCMYSIIDTFVDELMVDYLDNDENVVADIRQVAKEIAQREMAFIICRAVVYGLAKRAVVGFDTSDVEIALKPVSLTTHADNLLESVGKCKPVLKKEAAAIIAGLGHVKRIEGLAEQVNDSISETLNLG